MKKLITRSFQLIIFYLYNFYAYHIGLEVIPGEKTIFLFEGNNICLKRNKWNLQWPQFEICPNSCTLFQIWFYSDLEHFNKILPHLRKKSLNSLI